MPGRPHLSSTSAPRRATLVVSRCCLAALRLAANLDDDALAFVELPAAGEDLPCGQEGRTVVSDIDEHRTERREQPAHAAEVDAACFPPIPALDEQFDRNAVVEQRSAPLTGAGGD